MGKLKKRSDGRYQQSITLPNGKRKVFYGQSQAEITRKIAEFQYEANEGRTFEEVADAWQEKHAGEVRYKTAESHVAPTRRAKEYFADKRIKDITPPEVDAYIKSIEAKGLSKRTVQLHRDVLSMIFDFAIGTAHEIIYNPCNTVKVTKDLEQTTRDLPPQKDIEAIKAHKDDDRFSLLPFFLMYSGLRLGECLALCRDDFDFRKNIITVTKKVSWQPNQPVIDHFAKTDRGIRTVPMLDVLRDALPEWEGYLFEHNGKPYTKTFFRREWTKYAERTGVECDRHTLRHEFVTLLYDAGVDAPAAAKITGHTIEIMQRTYTHIRKEREELSLQKLNTYLAKKS